MTNNYFVRRSIIGLSFYSIKFLGNLSLLVNLPAPFGVFDNKIRKIANGRANPKWISF